MGGAHGLITPFSGYFAVTGDEQLCEPNIALLKENGKPGFRQLGCTFVQLICKVKFQT